MTKQVVNGCTNCGLDIDLVPFERVEQFVVNGVRVPVRTIMFQCPKCRDIVLIPVGPDPYTKAYIKYEELTGRKVLRKEI